MRVAAYMRVNSRKQLDSGMEEKAQMEKVDLTKEEMEEVEIKGKLALFTGLRPDKNLVPEGMYIYALRHGDDAGIPCSIEKHVKVNYFGTIITTEPFDFGDKDYISVKYDDFGFTGEYLNVMQFAEKMDKCRTGKAPESCDIPEKSVRQNGHNTPLPTKERER